MSIHSAINQSCYKLPYPYVRYFWHRKACNPDSIYLNRLNFKTLNPSQMIEEVALLMKTPHQSIKSAIST